MVNVERDGPIHAGLALSSRPRVFVFKSDYATRIRQDRHVARCRRVPPAGSDSGRPPSMRRPDTGRARIAARAAPGRGQFTVGNRFCIQPMEGWDGTEDGRPSELTVRRWQRFGESGAKLIWGGEAVAVRPEGRANPNQLVLSAETARRHRPAARDAARRAPRAVSARTDDLLVGLQLTHSGRFCRPNRKDRLEPRIVYRHPILDRKFGIPPDYPLLTDGEIRGIIADYVAAAAGPAAGVPVPGPEALPRLPGPRVPQRVHARRAVRRLVREPHPLPARDRRGHPRRGAGDAPRRPSQRLRPRAVPARSGALHRAGSSAPASRRSSRTACRIATPSALIGSSRPSRT